jgi:glyoxylase-like metal-dependent hydrolase (beta-lactamase superfamily II)
VRASSTRHRREALSAPVVRAAVPVYHTGLAFGARPGGRPKGATVKLNDDVHVLPLPMARDGQVAFFNVTLILDPAAGATLVDTGLPGHQDAIASALAEVGLQIADLRRVIITHQDFDHVGSLRAVVDICGAEVLAHAAEVPTIDGTRLPRFAAPEVLEQRPELRPVVAAFQPTAVDTPLQDGDRLDIAGGVRVVFTPGHTPGHASLYLERSKTLITGDALSAEDGRLSGPNPGATIDMAEAARSARKLAALDVAAIVCYHGGVVSDDANGQLRRVADELAHLA